MFRNFSGFIFLSISLLCFTGCIRGNLYSPYRQKGFFYNLMLKISVLSSSLVIRVILPIIGGYVFLHGLEKAFLESYEVITV